MKYHKKLKREVALKYGWRKLLLMIASELSRANSLSQDGGGAEVNMCLMRAKELLGVLEIDPSLPPNIGLSLLPILKKRFPSFRRNYATLYNKFMTLAHS